jgi:hypothetical protein
MSTIQQRCVSKDLTHFVGRSKKVPEEQYQLLLQIVRSGELRTNPTSPPGTRVISGRTSFGAGSSFASVKATIFRGSASAIYHSPILKFMAASTAALGLHFRSGSCWTEGHHQYSTWPTIHGSLRLQNIDLDIDNRSYTDSAMRWR